MATLLRSLDGHLDAVEVTDLIDGSFLARLVVRGPAGERCLDTRPSDAIALAMRLEAPLFVSEAVLDEAGALPHVEVDEVAIDETVDEFRRFLDEVDPSRFATEAAWGADQALDESAPTDDADATGGPTDADHAGAAEDGS